MCYSFESSISAWFLSIFIALYLYYRNRRNDRWNAAFIFTFTLIQLLEAGVWSNRDKNGIRNCNLDSFLVYLILIVLLLQPLIQTYFGYLNTSSKLLYLLTFLYLFIFVYTICTRRQDNFFSSIGKNGHLVWNSNKQNFLGSFWIGVLYIIGLFLPLLFSLINTMPLIIVGVATLMYSMSRASTKEFSSLWCYYAVLYAFVSLFV